ncbi:MAG: hypothetical protein M1358_19740, partial [Chloroflexi bacterium]|nr:hypothetical protein [Chloroflexota bacterium]
RLAADAEPVIKEVVIQLPQGATKHGRSYLEILKDELSQRGIGMDRARLKALWVLDADSFKEGATLSCFLQGAELCDLQIHPASTRFGLALDIGTTTVSLALLDLRARAVLNIVTRLNPQANYGADVISRITHASNSPESRTELTGLLIEAVNQMIGELLRGEGLNPG